MLLGWRRKVRLFDNISSLRHFLLIPFTLTAAAAGSKSYILRSTLHPNLIEYSSRTLEKLFEDEIPEDEPEDEDKTLRTYGSILSWSSSDQLGAIGITYVILALVLLSGRVMSDSEFFEEPRIDYELTMRDSGNEETPKITSPRFWPIRPVLPNKHSR